MLGLLWKSLHFLRRLGHLCPFTWTAFCVWGNEGFMSICCSGIIRAATTKADNNVVGGSSETVCIRPGWGAGDRSWDLTLWVYKPAVTGPPCLLEHRVREKSQGEFSLRGTPRPLVGVCTVSTLGVQTLSCVDRWHDSAQLGSGPVRPRTQTVPAPFPSLTLRCFRHSVGTCAAEGFITGT